MARNMVPIVWPIAILNGWVSAKRKRINRHFEEEEDLYYVHHCGGAIIHMVLFCADTGVEFYLSIFTFSPWVCAHSRCLCHCEAAAASLYPIPMTPWTSITLPIGESVLHTWTQPIQRHRYYHHRGFWGAFAACQPWKRLGGAFGGCPRAARYINH